MPGNDLLRRRAGEQHAERDHLHRRLPLGELRDVDLHVELGKELAQPGDEDLAHEDDDRRPDRPAGDGVVVHQHHQHGADQQLVGDRIEHAAERRLLLPHAGEIAVEPVGQAGKHEQRERRPARHVALAGRTGRRRAPARLQCERTSVRSAGSSAWRGRRRRVPSAFGTPSGRWVVNGAHGPAEFAGRQPRLQWHTPRLVRRTFISRWKWSRWASLASGPSTVANSRAGAAVQALEESRFLGRRRLQIDSWRPRRAYLLSGLKSVFWTRPFCLASAFLPASSIEGVGAAAAVSSAFGLSGFLSASSFFSRLLLGGDDVALGRAPALA